MNLGYSSSTMLKGAITADKIIKSASVTILETSGTPYTQVTRLTISGLNTTTLTIKAYGSGFVTGHVLTVSGIIIQ